MMKKSKMNNNSNKVTNRNTNKVTDKMNNNSESIGFDTNKVSNDGSFKYDENADHSFELRDCK